MKKYFVVLIILTLLGCNIESLNAQSIEDGLIAYYPFNGNANDESGNSWHATPNDPVLTNDRIGIANSAYYFDGIDDTINVYNHNGNLTFNSNDQFSISLWFEINDKDKGVNLLSHKAGIRNGMTWLKTASNHTSIPEKIQITIEGSTNDVNYSVISKYTIQTNEWYHIVLLFDGVNNLMKLYINSEFNDSIIIGTDLIGDLGKSSIPFSFGKRVGEPSNTYLKGKLDDIRIYDRVLNSPEIVELYNENKKPIITINPQSKTICKGQNSALLSYADGVRPITYQWQKDGSNIPGAIDSLYVIAKAQLLDAGNYTCIATNSLGSDTSAVAIIDVQEVTQSTIGGPKAVDEWQTVTYSVTEQTGHTYDFSVIGGTEISNTTNSITVQWGTIGWGHIRLVETISAGCVGDTVDLEVAVGDIVGINDNIFQGNLYYFPNPVSNYLYLSKKQKIEIYSLQGKILLSEYAAKINVSALTNGLYILRVNNCLVKLIKQ